MKTNAQSGKDGEAKALEYLKEKGWEILLQNYRHKRGELDIIAIDKGVLVFVEVKFRKNDSFGFPEDFVGDHKINMIRKTATNYIESENWKIAQERRLKDFEERKSDEIRNYFKTDEFDSEFITVHPMADEDWWFKKFNESPKICKGVDLYWKFDGDVAFV